MYYSTKKKCGGTIALVLTGVMFLAGCGNTGAASTEIADVVVDMQQADVGTLTLRSNFVGTVSPQELVYVIPFASGTITEVNYNVGDYVNVGDVLFKIDDEGARMQLEQARLSAANAKQQVDMATGSQQKSTDLQLESAKLQARSGYEQAQIAYFQVKRAYEQLDDSVQDYKDLVEGLETALKNQNLIATKQSMEILKLTFPQSNTSTSGNARAQADAVPIAEIEVQADAVSIAEIETQADAVPIAEIETQADAAPIAEIETQADAVPAAAIPADIAAEAQQVLAKANTQLESLRSSRDNLHDQLLQAESAYNAAEEGLRISENSVNLTRGELRNDANAQAKTSLALAQLGVESAELALSYYTVTAPISGVVQSKSVEVNGIAGQQSPAFVIANENSMQVTFQVSESVKNTLRVGDAIAVERGGENFSGNITEVGVAVNQQTGLFQVKASVNADGDTLPAGVSVKLTADTYSINNVILIPYDAVYYDSTGAYVYLCVDKKAVKTYVTTDIFDDTTIAITEGISKGDMVITSWSPRLLNGVQVTAADTIGK